MVPNTTMRLGAVLKTIDDIVIPAIPEDKKFAREQLALIQKSIALVKDQIINEYGFMIRDALDCFRLADELAAIMPENEPMRANLLAQKQQGAEFIPTQIPNRQATEDFLRSFKKVLEDTVDASLSAEPQSSDEQERRRKIIRAVLEHSERQTIRERAWVVDTGFDTDPDSLPSIEAILFKA
ncbi:MAG: hypothetical protein M0Q95_18880 [Porticoccaceae bacterium]|nr:hypothetical protein [Porticoccaceae bacterium]